jgi:uncharacterized protein with NRDE domain
MCTIVALHHSHPDFPLVVAANRDEFYARPTTEPRVLAEEPRVVGGRDEQGGGTWMGVTEGGMFLGITNQRDWAGFDARAHSRGLLALSALQQGNVDRTRRYLRELDPRHYNSFNLIFGDAEHLWIAYGRRDQAEMEMHELPQGQIHVLTNDRIGSPYFPKAKRAHALAEQASNARWPELQDRLHELLADHELPAPEEMPPPPDHAPVSEAFLHQLQALCIHTPTYGTRSATLLALEPGRIAHYSYAPGPPCQTPLGSGPSTLLT